MAAAAGSAAGDRCSVETVHFVIMGCGRVGASLARALGRAGHDVAVIDQEESAFRRLGAEFDGQRILGVGFDRHTLREAGIEQAHGFAAVSSGDNSNILAARVAREKYGVDNVVARIYDPGRAAIYQRLGIPTVATVKWTSDQVLRRLLPPGHVPEYIDPSGKVVLAEIPIASAWVGRPHAQIEAATGGRIAFMTRLGEGMIPPPKTLHQDGDLVHLVLRRDQVALAERVLDGTPPTH